jgi:hypothetical protein
MPARCTEFGVTRVNEDRAAGRTGADQRALRTAQDLDAGQVIEAIGLHDRRLEQAVHVGGDAGGCVRRVAREPDAADVDRLRLAGVRDRQRRRGRLQVGEPRHRAGLERRGIERGRGDRYLLQVFLAPLRGHDGLLEQDRRQGRCLILRHRHPGQRAAQQHPANQNTQGRHWLSLLSV